jgi:hypothetical protein
LPLHLIACFKYQLSPLPHPLLFHYLVASFLTTSLPHHFMSCVSIGITMKIYKVLTIGLAIGFSNCNKHLQLMVFIQPWVLSNKLQQLQWTPYVIYNIIYTVQFTCNYIQLLCN